MAQFTHHLHTSHSLSESSEEVWSAIQACETSISVAQKRRVCPLCRVDFRNARQLQCHLADHLEQLAFFAAVPASGQDESLRDFELLEDSDAESDIAAMSAIQSIPDSIISQKKVSQEKVQMYFEVMSHFTAEAPFEDLGGGDGQISLAEKEKIEIEYPVFIVVHTANESFYGREEALARMYEKLKGPGNILLVTGVGGVGKTELAVQYAYRFKERYDCVFWIQADTDPGLVESFCQIAVTLNLVLGTEDQNQIIELSREWLMHTGNSAIH